jgi:hypothetical protein
MQESHISDLVLSIVCRRWEDAERLVAGGCPDPATFVAQCRECDVHAWVHHLLTSEGRTELVGETAVASLAELRNKVRYDTMLLFGRAEQALDLLVGAGVTPIALKGLDFLHRIYSEPDLRATDDVDLLIRRDDLAPALEVLRGAGWQLPPEAKTTHYIRSSHHLPLRSPGPIQVEFELHWNLAQSERYTIDVDALFGRAMPLEVAGRQLLRLEDNDVVAHLLIHHFSHYFDRRLKWLVDLQGIDQIRPVDWNAVAARVDEWGGSAASGVSLAHLHKLSSELIPRRALESLPVAAWRRALVRPLRSNHPLELFKGTRNRKVQLYLAAVMLDDPARLPGWLRHRARRDQRPSDNPLDEDNSTTH